MQDGLDIGLFESHSAYERQRHYRRVFDAVVNGYRDILSASPLVACNYDEDVRPRRLGPELIHLKVDIERATQKALGNNPSMLEVWNQVIEGVDVPAALFAQVASKCGRIYAARKLTPFDYLRVVKRGRADLRSTKIGVAA